MKYKYGTYNNEQIEEIKIYIRKQIYFLLLIVDPNTKDEYKNVDVQMAYNSLLKKLAGFNELLLCPPELVHIMALLEAAQIEYKKENFNYKSYRKLVLDAGSEVLNINKEVS